MTQTSELVSNMFYLLQGYIQYQFIDIKLTYITSHIVEHKFTTEVLTEEVHEKIFVEVFPNLVMCVGLANIDTHTK